MGSDIQTTYVCNNFGFQGEKFIKVSLYVSFKIYICASFFAELNFLKDFAAKIWSKYEEHFF